MKEIGILMAAGLGSRMRPLTDVTAKPLVQVNGVPLIETVIAALNKRGVSEIYVVVGYKKEQFKALETKHPNLHLVENPKFDTMNNINSIAVVADKMRENDCFICEADLFLPNEDLLCRELKESGYFGKMVKGHSDDWYFATTPEKRITAIGKGCDDCYNMMGVSYFRQREAMRIADAVSECVKQPEWAQRFWDEVVDKMVKDGLELVVHELHEGDIVECDTVEDLKQLEAKLLSARKER